MENVATLNAIEHLQSRLLAGDGSRFDHRSPNTVNSVIRVVMAFFRYCYIRKWLSEMPHVEMLTSDDIMKGRPISGLEFQRMLDSTASVVGNTASASWKFALQVLWTSAFRIGDLMDFSWDDPRHIHPVWGRSIGDHPTLAIPSSQKNGKVQEVPMLPELGELLAAISESQRFGWVVNPEPIEFDCSAKIDSFRPSESDLIELSKTFRSSAIAEMCHVSETAVRKWLANLQYSPNELRDEVPAEVAQTVRLNAVRMPGEKLRRQGQRMTKEYVGKVISRIGETAGIVVQIEDSRLKKRQKFASAHDIRRGVAQRLINCGVSAESLKVIMRHKNFATTERHYGAIRSAQTAAAEISAKLSSTQNRAIVGGLVGGMKKAPQLNAEELEVLKSLVSKL